MIGLYGIQSHLVARRTREVGVRMALGAAARQIQLMMLREGYRPVFEGLVIGFVFGALVRTIIRSYVNAQVTPIDPVAFAIVPVPLILAAFFACYVPARRASRVDPNEALRICRYSFLLRTLLRAAGRRGSAAAALHGSRRAAGPRRAWSGGTTALSTPRRR